MPVWLRAQWLKFQGSVDQWEALLQSRPVNVLIMLGASLAIVFAATELVPEAQGGRLTSPWPVVALLLLAATSSIAFWISKGRSRLSAVLTLADTVLYSAAVALALVRSSEPLSFAFGFILIILLMQVGRTWSFNWVMTLALAATIGGIVLPHWDQHVVKLLLPGFGFALYLFLSTHTGRQRALLRQNAQLRTALGTADQMLSDSLDAALTSTLLGIGRFLHEVRNTHSALGANLSFLADQAQSLDKEGQEALGDSLRCQEKLRKLVEELLGELRNRTSEKRGPMRLDSLLAEFVQRSAVTASPSVSLSGELPLFWIRGNELYCRTVLETLVRNASEAGACALQVVMRVVDGGLSAEIIVADDGPGLSDAALEKVFRPFGTEGKSDGTGLGLYLAKRYVELMGGTIAVANQEHGGAAFTIRLPGSTRQDHAAAQVEPSRARS